MYEPNQIWSYSMQPEATTSSDDFTGSSGYLRLVCTMSARKPKLNPPGSLGPLARLAGRMSAISTNAACFAANARSATAASPAHILYASMNDMPICIADHLEVVPPSQVLTTVVGMCTACQRDLPTAFFNWAAWSFGNALLMSRTYCLSIESASSSSPVKTLT